MQRVTGIDLARALAIFGMIIVNYKLTMNAETGNLLLISFAKLFEGRASALFVILAGIGITFFTNKARASGDRLLITNSRIKLVKRGMLLIFIGLIYTPIWPADILHYYGFYFLVAAAIFTSKTRTLLYTSAGIMLLFPVLMLFFDYLKNWDWSTLSYQNFWTFDGLLRRIIFNGFNPIIPWVAFLIFGMWLGRLDLSDKPTRKKLFLASLITLIVTEATFYLLRLMIGDGSIIGLAADEVSFLFSTAMIPPLPQYLLSAGSSSLIVLTCSLYLSERFPDTPINIWLQKTGQLSLSLYVAHVIIGMGILDAINRLANQTIEFALFYTLIFCLSSMCFSVIWLRFFSVGPLEVLFRKVTR